jgi:hypothetical protein
MKQIKEYVDQIAEELESAKDYGEKALWYKSKGNNARYTKYKEMAQQELSHADGLHTMAVEDIQSLEKTFPNPPEEMMDAWIKSHNKFIEKTAWIKQILAM